MATWNKIILSGSNAELASLKIDGIISGSIFSGSFVGDGSGLTGIEISNTNIIQTVEVNVGNIPRKSGKFIITGSGFITNNPVLINLASGPYTNKGTLDDESEMDNININAYASSPTEIKCFWNATSFVKGNFKFNYIK